MTSNPDIALKRVSLGRLALRGAAVFGAVGILGFAGAIGIEGYDPWVSDDPYLVGILLGAIGAAASAGYTMFETFVRWPIVDVLYFGLLGLWSLMLLAGQYLEAGGGRMGVYVATIGWMAVAAAWPICRLRVPRIVALISVVAGSLLVAAYALVIMRLAQG